MRVLIVDDDEAMAEMLASVCESDGHEARACGSSAEATSYLEGNAVDLLITDIAMAPPDGLELVRSARALQPDLMAIAVTGYWGRYSLPEVLATGALDLMFKPFRVEELRARLAMAAERRRMSVEEKGRALRIAVSLERARVLLIDDNATDAEALKTILADRDGGLFELTHASTLDEGMAFLAREGVDIVLLDFDLEGEAGGLSGMDRIHTAAPGVAVVVLTSHYTDPSAAARVLQAGGQDYVVRGHLSDHPLQRVLLHAIERQRLLVDSDAMRRQRQQLREELVLHELKIKDEFMSHVSHELRSPLTAIHQFSTILMDGLAGPLIDDQKDALRVIIRNIYQLESMIDDLLEVTRMQNGKLRIDLQSVLVSEVIDDGVDTLCGVAQGKEVALTREIADGLPTAYADPVRTRQVLINLIGNALKFTPTGGTVIVRAGLADEPGFIRFEVEDTGCGIAPESAARIFERLYQVKEPSQAGRKGLGLGLFICRELVDQQGGRIWVRSEPGRGSSFFFTLPVFTKDTPLTTRDVLVKRDLIARVEGPDGPITSAPVGEGNG